VLGNYLRKKISIYKYQYFELEHTLSVLENRVLRKIFRPKRDKVRGEWRRQGALQSLPFTKYSGEKTKKYEIGGVCVYRFLVGDLRERDHLGDPGVDRRITLRWIFRKWDVGV
jgi:hypothetical protein